MIDVSKYLTNHKTDNKELKKLDFEDINEFDDPILKEKTITKYYLEFEELLPALKKKEILYVGYDRVYSLDEIIHISINDLEWHKAFTEHLYIILLNTNNDIIGISEMSHGSFNETITPIKEIIITALLAGASRFYLVHNHPNNVNKLSNNDKIIVCQIRSALVYLELELLDSIVITPNGNYSSFMLETEEG